MQSSNAFLDALACKNTGRTPVWLMRQAGRYLPSYQAYRKKYSLKELFSNAELAAEITLLPIQELQPDAAILFSDIMMIAEGFGLKLDYVEGPVVTPQIRSHHDLHFQQVPEVIPKTIKLLRKELRVPLIGFSGGPFTVASYLIGDVHQTKKWLYRDRNSFLQLLEKITDATILYLQAQEVDAVQIFETHAHVLSEEDIGLLLPYLQKIITALTVPVILFMKGSCLFIDQLIPLAPSAISLDWHKTLPSMRKIIPTTIAIQGNFDPHLLYAPHDVIRKKVKEALATHDPSYIASLGHGVLPDMDVDAVKVFIDAVKNAH